jgi:hypothetical protein
MKALILTERLDDPCYRYRMQAFLPALKAIGFQVDSICLHRGILARTRQLFAARGRDVVIVQRKLMASAQIGILRSMAQRVVYDMDDALFCRDGLQGKGTYSRKLTSRFRATMRSVDLAIVGNEYLKQHAAEHLDPCCIEVVPTCVDPSGYPIARHLAVGANVKLAWIGQACTLQAMASARSCISAAGRRLPGLTLRIICDARIDIDDLLVELCPWSLTSEAADLASADIGISWLPDNPFHRGKCALKILQYMAAGLPVVANPVGVASAIVAHGKSGFIASTPEEWADAIERLALSPALRRQMGIEGRKIVEDNYSVAVWGPRFAKLVGNAASSRESARPAA